MRLYFHFFLACILLGAGCGDNPSQLSSENARQFSLITREVVFFSSDWSGDAKNIFMMTTDGKIIKKITHHSGGEYAATAISPDNSRLLFYEAIPGLDIDAGMNIYIYWTKLDSIEGPITQGRPGNFSPDGRLFVFSRHTFTPEDGYSSVYTYDLANGSETKLTEDGKTSFHPQFSPDGTKILFESAKFWHKDSISCWQLHLLDLRTNTITDLTKAENGHYAGSGVFSPDGRSIVFHYNQQTWCYDICRISLSTGTISYITRTRFDGKYKTALSSYNPSISPIDQRIYFYSKFVDYQYLHPIDVYSINSDGSGLKNLTDDSYWDSHPVVGTVSFYIKQ